MKFERVGKEYHFLCDECRNCPVPIPCAFMCGKDMMDTLRWKDL